MRAVYYRAALLAMCWSGLAAPTVAQDEAAFEPYIAYVNSNDVYVRSGPGKNYYPTEKLNAGDEVEVYRHDPGGWLAIRPPAGSFSWVSGRYLRPLEDNLGVVTGDKVVSRVGTRFSNVRDVIQVRLERGEKVEIYSEEIVQDQTWFKIAPPAGEFRWIASNFVSRDLAANGLSAPRSLTRLEPEPEYSAADAAAERQLSARGELSEVDQLVAVAEESSGIDDAEAELRAARLAYERALQRAQQRQEASTFDEGSDEDPVRFASAGEEDAETAGRAELAQFQQPATRGASAPRDRTASLAPPASAKPGWSAPRERGAGTADLPGPPITGLNFDAELATLDLDLGTTIANEPVTWRLDELYARLEILQRAAATAIQRGHVREFRQKLDRMDDIRRRHVALASGNSANVGALAARTPANTVQLAPRSAASAAPGAAEPAATTGTTAPIAGASNTTLPMLGAAAGSATAPDAFDGEGVLRPVISKRRDAPRYALVDAAGNVASFVTPAPGLNLQPYVGHRVGMVGTRGFMQELRKPHVMAKRVSLLDQPVVR